MNAKTLKNKTGKKIKELRKLKNLQQKELALLLNCDSSNISKLETGKSFPSAEIIASLCKILDCTPKDFFNF